MINDYNKNGMLRVRVNTKEQERIDLVGEKLGCKRWYSGKQTVDRSSTVLRAVEICEELIKAGIIEPRAYGSVLRQK